MTTPSYKWHYAACTVVMVMTLSHQHHVFFMSLLSGEILMSSSRSFEM